MKYIVLSAKPYDFENNKGERINGVKISYVNRKPSSRDGEYGNPPMITTCSNDSIKGKRLEECPAIFDLDFEQVTGKNNRPELLLTDIEYIAPVDLSLFFN
ncbi:hypothetical protein D3C81_869220 [compost metagenome]